ncbi:NEDD8 ultimate buster 1 [Impatiens glandulifera]|uniref:NEDD8 ultimate buster 1 n=1 Tax=Impatiens glandulifera TaxID=253017 RepID=UPI001FB0B063|nr:NEDD8 ultimate buster 1 [Impatiens glandulifera]
MSKLKIAGAWTGVLELELEDWTVSMLRAEVAKRSDCSPDSINLICAGKVLKDGDGTDKLIQIGVKNNAKILATRVSADKGKALNNEMMAEEDRSKRLSRIKAAADSLAKRHADGSLPFEDFNMELENQSGEKVQLGSETDQRAIMMGLMLHQKAKTLIRKQKYSDALEVLIMGEESFSLSNHKVIQMIDNVPILQLDIVWCYLMLQDITLLADAGLRLSKAREGIERSHGKESSRLKLIQGDCNPETALHLRMELLEGIVAYHSGQLEKSRKSLNSAQAKFLRLQVSDEALSLLISMGYKERDSKRALRMSNQNIQSAVNFLIEDKAKVERKRDEDIQRRDEIKEQKRYGTTKLKKAVDMKSLTELSFLGFEKVIAAEALRRNENDFQKALDDLTSPETNAVIQIDVESRKRKRQRSRAENVNNATTSDSTTSVSTTSVPVAGESGMQDDGIENSVTANNEDAMGSAIEDFKDEIYERDVEMEDELTEELQRVDPFSDYDIEFTKEGEAISEYLALLSSSTSGEKN